jgi:hypothetical protein
MQRIKQNNPEILQFRYRYTQDDAVGGGGWRIC